MIMMGVFIVALNVICEPLKWRRFIWSRLIDSHHDDSTTPKLQCGKISPFAANNYGGSNFNILLGGL